MKEICRDLQEEQEALDSIVAPLSRKEWDTITPFIGWSIKYEIAHLAFWDMAAKLAATDEQAFRGLIESMFASEEAYNESQRELREADPAFVMEYWRRERKALVDALAAKGPKDRIPWVGPTMSARSKATARIMETWAHGQDVADTLGIEREPTDRLRHVAHLGVTTFGWSHANRGLEVPDVAVRVELTGPSGDLWTWGPEDAEESIKGPALDFCLVVVQRRHVEDTSLLVKGDVARNWMLIAQAFAGPPVDGPRPGERVLRK
ncbi:MAG: TIGR03084 family protein [Deltaproteobacteria bacterium]|nr:MAG: TIGR03084 family protein [Deltaproteobacteria bacterium]